jgi:hypothetical protein
VTPEIEGAQAQMTLLERAVKGFAIHSIHEIGQGLLNAVVARLRGRKARVAFLFCAHRILSFCLSGDHSRSVARATVALRRALVTCR